MMQCARASESELFGARAVSLQRERQSRERQSVPQDARGMMRHEYTWCPHFAAVRIRGFAHFHILWDVNISNDSCASALELE